MRLRMRVLHWKIKDDKNTRPDKMKDTDQPEDKKEIVESLAETNVIFKSNDTQEDENIETTEEVEDKEDIDDIDKKR